MMPARGGGPGRGNITLEVASALRLGRLVLGRRRRERREGAAPPARRRCWRCCSPGVPCLRVPAALDAWGGATVEAADRQACSTAIAGLWPLQADRPHQGGPLRAWREGGPPARGSLLEGGAARCGCLDFQLPSVCTGAPAWPV